jgi:hypothetical protein
MYCPRFPSLSFVAVTRLAAATVLFCLAAAPQFAHAQFQVRTADPTGASPGALQTIEDINEAEQLFSPANGANISGFSSIPTISFGAFPNGMSGTEDFALEALARLTFNTAGNYVLRVSSDDGFRLRTGVAANGTGGSVYSEFLGERASGATDGSAFSAAAGSFQDIRLTYFERGGGEEVFFSYSLNGSGFQTVGATSDISVSAIPVSTAAAPEPSALALLAPALSLAGIVIRRRKRMS